MISIENPLTQDNDIAPKQQETVKPCLLIVDDEDVDRELCTRLFNESSEFRIIEASTGKEAIKLLTKHQPDCVLLDYFLGGEDGLEVLKQMLHIYPHQAVIFLTGLDDNGIAAEAIKAGAYAYIIKDFIRSNLDIFKSAVTEAIEYSAVKEAIRYLNEMENTTALPAEQ